MKLLLERGADPKTRNHAGETIMTLALRKGDTEIIQLLERFMARPREQNGVRRRYTATTSK
jgi:ankyrin repeat protein